MGQRRGASVQTCAEENKARHLGHFGRASMAAAAAVQEAEAPCLQSFELCETELVAQYASSNGQGKAASDAVDECLRALEDLDSLLLKASRKDPSASVEVMRSKIIVALGALDNLLQTVPSAVMDKGKAIADAYRTPTDGYEEGNGAELDPRLKQLQDIR